MYKIIERRMIVPNMHEFTVEAPAVAESVQAGQFRHRPAGRYGERIPLSVADWDREAGHGDVGFHAGRRVDRQAGPAEAGRNRSPRSSGRWAGRP